MRSLIRFILQHQNFFLFFLLEGLAFALLINHNAYQGAAFFNFSSKFTGQLNEKVSNITHYFELVRENKELMEENAQLKMKLFNSSPADTIMPYSFDSVADYTVIPAQIISNTVSHRSNYLVINVGKRDSIAPGMGVVSSQGVVGVVKGVSNRYSVVMPIINHQYHVSSKLKRNNYFGSLSWDGVHYQKAQLEAIEKHVPLLKNDTVVTSGFGRTFPQGIPVGIIDDFHANADNDFYNINVRLAVNFKTISQVHIIKLSSRAELETLIEDQFND